jgi:hypothetical protein
MTMSHVLMSLSLSATLSGALPDLVRDALQNKADRWFHWLLISSGVVFLGVAFETWEATITLKRWWRLGRGKEVNEPNEKSWAIPFSYLGLLLVIVGVFGEGVFEGLVSNADTALRAHDDQILAQAQREAGDAATSAHNAAKDAGEAKIKADAADIASGGAMKNSIAANKAVSDALTRLMAVKWNLESLGQAVNPRRLDRKVFLDALAGKPKGTAEIWYEPNDPEAKFFAEDLHNDLGPNGAGWRIEDTKPLSEVWDSNDFVYGEHMSPLDKERIEANVNSVEGVQITGNKMFPPDMQGKTAFGALTWAIIRGLEERHFGGMSTVDPTLPDDHFVIVVGHHRANAILLELPWQNPPPALANTKHASKPRSNK